MQKKLRVFLDTSAILAGLNSPSGGAGVVLSLVSSSKIVGVISPQIIEEGEHVVGLKFPQLYLAWTSFLLLQLEVTPTPSLTQVRRAYTLLPTSDAPILASAIQAKPDALVTWNTRDFLRPHVVESVKFPIFRPGDFLQLAREKRILSS
ncbi:MAG: PIN domain-containing protein [Candidatus Kerfeldbacteria bacterium]|nr:PIN domain-containing protein [Candidatus Kerfeldbacteria bacterium]